MEIQDNEGLEWESIEEKEKQDTREERDRFTSFMFGPRRGQHHQNPRHHHQQQENSHNQSTVNYEELMMNIDTLMESIRGLKPLFQKVIPLVEQYWKKK